MDALTAFGLFAVTAMMVCYALESRSRWYIKDAPASPEAAERYLRGKFGDALNEVRAGMERLAASRTPRDLEANGFKLYEAFRPEVPPDVRGWGAKGVLDMGRILALVKAAR